MTYKEAMKTLKNKKTAAGTLRWDAGEGWTGEGYWCSWRNRIVMVSVSPEGKRIV